MTIGPVRVEHVAPVTLAVVRGRASPGELSRAIPAACGEVWAYAREATLRDPGRHVAVYFDGAVTYECGVEVAEPFTGTARVMCSATPAGMVATVTLIGPYSELAAAHAAIRAWGAGAGQAFAGTSWEVYGHWTDDSTKLRTDVFYLLAPVGATSNA